MSSSEVAGDHFGGGGPARRPGAILASTWNWGMKRWCTSMRVLAAGVCAAAGATPPIPEIAPRPSAAAPPARNFRRAGLDGPQHWHVVKNLRRVGLAFIPSSRFVVMALAQ